MFDKPISAILFGKDLGSIAPMGFMLIGFAIYVFIVSILRNVNKYLVGSIILMDAFWVLGSGLLVATSSALFTTPGLLLVSLVALIIAAFAFFQTKGLRMHLNNQA